MSETLTVQERSLTEIECSVRIKTQALKRNIVVGICEIAADLLEAKAKCPHGQWGDSLKRMGYSSSTFSNYTKILEKCKNTGISGVNLQTFESLEYSKALALLALPDGKEAEFMESVDVENTSVRELKAEVKRWKEAEAEAKNQADGWRLKAEQAKADADALKESADKLSEELGLQTHLLDVEAKTRRNLEHKVKELENRPVDVAVQTVDATREQIEKAEAEGRRKAVAEAADKMEASERTWRETVEQLRAQNKSLREQLEAQAASVRTEADGVESAGINAVFKTLVGAANQLLTMLGGLDEITRRRTNEKLVKFFRSTADKLDAK